MWADSLLILVISICTALLGEGVTWLLVYRTDKYQKLKLDIEKQTKKLEKKKEAHGDATLDRTQKRKMERDEERLKSTNRDLMLVSVTVQLMVTSRKIILEKTVTPLFHQYPNKEICHALLGENEVNVCNWVCLYFSALNVQFDF